MHVEGDTEETFVNEILAPHLYTCGLERVDARIVGNARQRDRRGGIKPWAAVRKDIVRHLLRDTGCHATILVDYYGMPQVGDRAWPGRREAGTLPFERKAPTVERELQNDICAQVGVGRERSRFIPYVMMHEFEALLFSDPGKLAKAVGNERVGDALMAIRNAFETPEHINDSPTTAPSKRIQAVIPGYQKPLFGNIAALEIGLDSIRAACPLFSAWVARLEELGIPPMRS